MHVGQTAVDAVGTVGKPRLVLSGVTVITHGFQLFGSYPDWPISMGQVILEHADGERTDRVVGSLFKHNPAMQPERRDMEVNTLYRKSTRPASSTDNQQPAAARYANGAMALWVGWAPIVWILAR